VGDWKIRDDQTQGRWKIQDWKMSDEIAGMDIAGLENEGRKMANVK